MKLSRGQMGGVIMRAQSFAGLWLTETSCLPHHRAPKHSHELFQFCLVRAGAYTESCGRKERLCTTFSLISHPSGEPHSNIYHDKGARSFIIEMEDTWLDRVREYSVVLDESVFFKAGLPTWLAARIYSEFQNMDRVSPLIIEALLLELMGAVSRQAPKSVERTPPHWFKQVIELINDCFPGELSLVGISKSVGVHPVHLARTFRFHQNCTIGEYVRRLRVEAACRELSLTDTPLSQIALSVGYYDQSHFSRNFKQLIGITPAKYRAAFRSR